MIAGKKYSGQLAVASLLVLGTVDIAVTYAISGYGSNVCGWGQTKTDDALVLQVFASTLFVLTATICVFYANRTSKHQFLWNAFAFVFILAETVLKVAAAGFPKFFACW